MEFTVAGMTCEHCVRAVTKAVRTIDPEADVQIDLAAKRVAVQSKIADTRSIEGAIAQSGYEVARRGP